METMPRESWTDERLDDFRGEVNRRFDETNRRMEAGFLECREEFRRINDRLDALHQMLFRGMVALGVGLLCVIAAFLLQR